MQTAYYPEPLYEPSLFEIPVQRTRAPCSRRTLNPKNGRIIPRDHTYLQTAGPYDTTRCTTSTAVRIDRHARYLLFFPNLEFRDSNRRRPPAVIRSLRPSEELAEGTK